MALPGEDGILALIDRHFPNRHSVFSLGRGDDCAFFQTSRPVAISSDLFLEDTHFRTTYFTPEEIGHKALAVNLSDLAACGSKPVGFSLSIGLPGQLDTTWLEGFFLGMARLAARHDIFLCGGDISRSDKILVAITIFGEKPDSGALLCRRGVHPGNTLFLVGSLGLARTGLCVLENMGREEGERYWPSALAAHVRPEPLLGPGMALGEIAAQGQHISLMDLSDGLARDLPRLLGPVMGAKVHIPEEALHAEVIAYCETQGLDATAFAVLGGEDYALLGACEAAALPAITAAIPSARILGHVTEDPAITYNGQQAGKGFDHFE